MSARFCPRCGSARAGRDRLCAVCAFDFDERAVPAIDDDVPTERPATAATRRTPRSSRMLLFVSGALILAILAGAIGAFILMRPSTGAISGLIGSTTGAAPVYRAPDATWADAPITRDVAVRRPADWTSQGSGDGHLDIYPPTSSVDSPSPLVSVTLIPGAKLADVVPPPATTPMERLTIAGHPAWRADDADRLPPYSRYVAVEIPGGVLFAQAYQGPGVDLSAFLDGILSTLATAP